MKELTIEIPDGHVIDMEKSDLMNGIIKFKPEVDTYGEIMVKLDEKYRLREIQYGTVYAVNGKNDKPYLKKGHIGVSHDQLYSLLALNKLINVATYLNDGWVPGRNSSNWLWHLQLQYQYLTDTPGSIVVSRHSTVRHSCVYFKEKQYAYEAIKILGRPVIFQALTLNHIPIKK